MTSKKRRQRGSRTHGGGTHKNRRGAGNRGGRGNAGRSKHQMHGQPPLGKHGFKRPPEVQREVAEIDVRTIDEDVALWAADDLAEETDFGYRVDARDVVEDADQADLVKVLGTGQVRNQLEVVADAFSETAAERIEAEGGDAVLTEKGEELAAAAEADEESEEVNGSDEEA